MNAGHPAMRGFSLIEVLVAIAVLSIGLLGMGALQMSGLRVGQGSFYRAQAAQFAIDMADRMRANQGAARNYGLTMADGAPTGTSVLDRDRADWLAKLRNLPGGDGAIAIDLVNNLVTITVQWDDSRAGGTAAESFTLVTRVWNN
jgi:type IV pilus assembly protein PilV